MKKIFLLIFILVLTITLCSCSKESIAIHELSEENQMYWLNNAEYLAQQLCVYTPVFSNYEIKKEDAIMAFILSTRHIDFKDYDDDREEVIKRAQDKLDIVIASGFNKQSNQTSN